METYNLRDGTLSRHQPFANPMARFGGRQLFWLLVTNEGARPFLLRTVIFAIVLSFQRPLCWALWSLVYV